MSLADLLAEGRQFAADNIFTDTCQAFHPGAVSGDLDPTTWARVATDVLFYSGPLRLKANRIQNPTPADVGGDFVIAQSVTASVPAGSPAFGTDDILIVTGSQLDGNRVGTRFRVTSAELSSQVTAQRFQVEAAVG